MNFFQFIFDNLSELKNQTLEHIGLTFLSLALAVVIAMPIGIWITRRERWSSLVLGITGIFQTIPSIALLGFLIPILGIGVKPAIFALLLYALLPILRNTYTGIKGVDANVKEAAIGMGMTPWQVLTKVELPLAMPVIFAGIRTATVINVGVATLAAYIGAGGLGEFIFGGIALNNTNMILAGALFAALLAIIFDQLLALLHRVPLRRILRTTIQFGAIMPILSLLYFMPQWFSDDLRAGFDPEFGIRNDGYPKLEKTYGLNLNHVTMNSDMMYLALKGGRVDVISGYSTDGRIKSFNLSILEDDKNAFPPYFCAPIIRQDLIQKHPEVADALNLLAGKMNDSIMTELNYRAFMYNEAPEKIAEDFLKSLQIWKPDRKQGGEKLIIGSKIFTEQYILAHLFSQLINGYTEFDTDIKAGLGGTNICFEALKNGEIHLYPEYTGTGFLVILSPSENEVDQLVTDAEALYDYVYNNFLEKYNIVWLQPLGFNNTYALMMRREMAKEAGLKNISDLAAISK
ncbi:MAG: ABC transporter permease/substrate-binding protein [Saprospiraceae bacterium]|nr:ABC transporter permease/substrate-binding protein [Saprospiraceae bacterium]